MKRGVATLVLFLMLASTAVALQEQGRIAQGDTIYLRQGCDTSTYSKISVISAPDSSVVLQGDVDMTKNGNVYNYTFNGTEQLGTYLVYGHCDEKGTDKLWVFTFEVTYTGDKVSLSNGYLVIALLFFSAILIVLAFAFSQEHWILKTFFKFASVGMGVLALNAANIIASESLNLGKMGTTGLVIGIVILGLFFLYMFVYAFIEAIKTLKEKGGLRWEY